MRLIGNDSAGRAAWGQREIEHRRANGLQLPHNVHPVLVAEPLATHKPAMPGPIFDMRLRSLRRDRAARTGAENFLYERAFADCLDRLALIQKKFSSALLIGCPDSSWPERLGATAERVDVVDPGALFAAAAGGRRIVEDQWEPEPQTYDLCMAIGTLDSVNDLPRALLAIRFALVPDGLLLGAMSGGETLPRLRAAMLAADRLAGSAAPHLHPRIAPAALARLLQGAGFQMPVVDIDRIAVSYASLGRLIGDLRGMGATNVLKARPRTALGKATRDAAEGAFAETGGRTTETFEIVHFAGWTPPAND